MPLQPRVAPNPTDPGKLVGQTAIVTGATLGLGLETSRQLIQLGLSTLVLAVRNIEKGEKVKQELLAAAATQTPLPEIRVMQLDMANPNSVTSFAARARTELDQLDILILNAGVGYIAQFEKDAVNAHERMTTVNFFSNALLLFELLPLLESATAHPSRVTWIGSALHHRNSIAKAALPLQPSVLGWFDDPSNYAQYTRYNDTKLLATMFVYELALRLDTIKVQLFLVDPGMVGTGLKKGMGFPVSLIVSLLSAVYARSVEHGGWLIVHSAVFAGEKDHGKFVTNRMIEP